jgi:hypothetical protein
MSTVTTYYEYVSMLIDRCCRTRPPRTHRGACQPAVRRKGRSAEIRNEDTGARSRAAARDPSCRPTSGRSRRRVTVTEVRGPGIQRWSVADTATALLATFAAALDALGERGLVNLMVLMGYLNIRCAQQALAGAACVL